MWFSGGRGTVVFMVGLEDFKGLNGSTIYDVQSLEKDTHCGLNSFQSSLATSSSSSLLQSI